MRVIKITQTELTRRKQAAKRKDCARPECDGKAYNLVSKYCSVDCRRLHNGMPVHQIVCALVGCDKKCPLLNDAKFCCNSHRARHMAGKEIEVDFPTYKCPNCKSVTELDFSPRDDRMRWRDWECPHCDLSTD